MLYAPPRGRWIASGVGVICTITNQWACGIKQEERTWTCGKTIYRLKANVRQGESRKGAFKGVPTSNARLTRRAMFEFASQLAPGLLVKIVMKGPRSCRGARSWRLGGWRRFPEKGELILQTDRLPQLETPLRYFLQDFTPKRGIYCATARGRYSDTR
jgi:hypothetical protein